MRGSGGGSAPSSPSPYTKPKQQSTSIEDFLRELSGAPPKRPQQKQTEWHAPKEEAETYYEKQKRAKDERQKRIQEQKEREHERKLQRELERKRKEQKRSRDPEPISIQEFITETRPKKKRRPVSRENDAYHVDHSTHASAYESKKASDIEKMDVAAMDKNDLKKAIVLREILGPPVALRKSDDYPA